MALGLGKVVGEAIVTIKGDLKGLTADLKKSEDLTLASVAKINAKMIGLGVAAVGAAAVAAGTSIGIITAKVAKMQDEMAKLAPAVNLSVEALSEFRFAAERGGLETTTFDGAMLALSRRIAKAHGGVAEFKKGFDLLGISLTDGQGKLKGTEAVLLEIADKFSGAADGAQKAMVAELLMGDAGQRLIPTLNLGAQGLEELRQQARDFGVSVDSGAAAASERMNDNVANLKSLALGAAMTLANRLIPTVAAITGAMVEWFQANSGVLKQGLEKLGDMIASGLRKAIPVIGVTIASILDGAAFLVEGFDRLGVGIGVVLRSPFVLLGDFVREKVAALLLTLEPAFKKILLVMSPLNSSWRDQQLATYQDLTRGLLDQIGEGGKLINDAWEKWQPPDFAVSLRAAASQVESATFEIKAGVERGMQEIQQVERTGNLGIVANWTDTFATLTQKNAEFWNSVLEKSKVSRQVDYFDHAGWLIKSLLLIKKYKEESARELEEARQRRIAAVADTLSTMGSLLSLFNTISAKEGKKGFEQQKKLRKVEVVINAAAAIVRAWANNDNWVAALAISAAIAAGAAQQLKTINAQEYQPQAAGGVDNLPEDQTILAHQGEMIVPKNPARQIRSVASDLSDFMTRVREQDRQGAGGASVVGGTVKVIVENRAATSNLSGLARELMKLFVIEVEQNQVPLTASRVLNTSEVAT